MRFAKHVVGLSCQMEAFDSAWVAGIFRAAAQNRPLRKQSSVLTVPAIQHLESLLGDDSLATVDRYATGVFLFAIFARARFGDLRQISSIVIDEANAGVGDHLGYLAAKCSEFCIFEDESDRKSPGGLGKASWGKTFINLAAQVNLDFSTWRPDDQAEQVTKLPLPVAQPAHSPDDWVCPPVGPLRGHEDAGREFADAQSAPWST
ncbi:unnamed protein product [Cladocopium goreaui]|uniref:Uncharacterized protein n=1 Tax=Cladocopium goreaui TaxID=2562237 RepID=A0A9P1FXH1_9DINO|nr:unnamed protein product [Cladocopium goreaui]